MSVKRPPRRYLGLRVSPPGASRREVSAAVEAAWKRSGAAGAPPRLLVCQGGAAIILVARGQERDARAAVAGTGGPVSLEAVVTSGTIAAVKERLGVKPERR